MIIFVWHLFSFHKTKLVLSESPQVMRRAGDSLALSLAATWTDYISPRCCIDWYAQKLIGIEKFVALKTDSAEITPAGRRTELRAPAEKTCKQLRRSVIDGGRS